MHSYFNVSFSSADCYFALSDIGGHCRRVKLECIQSCRISGGSANEPRVDAVPDNTTLHIRNEQGMSTPASPSRYNLEKQRIHNSEKVTKRTRDTKSKGSSKELRVFLCKKCRGHGKIVPLKKHSYRCPYVNCQCESCNKVMSERVTVMLRRYRNHAEVNALSFKPVRFMNGNIRFRVFAKEKCKDGIAFTDEPQSSCSTANTLSTLPCSPITDELKEVLLQSHHPVNIANILQTYQPLISTLQYPVISQNIQQLTTALSYFMRSQCS